MDKIKKILSTTYNNKYLRENTIPVFVGTTGLGKTSLVKEFAEEVGAKLVPLPLSTKDPFEISGMLFPDKENKRVVEFDVSIFRDLKDGDILFLDEVLNAPLATFKSLLTVLSERTLGSGYKLPDIMICGAANEEGMTKLLPQVSQRFLFYKVWENLKIFSKYFKDKYFLDASTLEAAFDVISEDKFNGSFLNNYSTPRFFEHSINLYLENGFSVNDNFHEILESAMIENKIGSIPLENGTIISENEMVSWKILYNLYKKSKQ